METLTAATVAKIVGAIVTFALGIWIGLGRPGMKGPRGGPRSRRATLRGTWINRMFFSMPGPARPFDASRLVVPKKRPPGQVAQRSGQGGSSERTGGEAANTSPGGDSDD